MHTSRLPLFKRRKRRDAQVDGLSVLTVLHSLIALALSPLSNFHFCQAMTSINLTQAQAPALRLEA